MGIATGRATIASRRRCWFDALLTCDRNVRTQQNLSGRRIALIEVSTNHWPTIRPVAAKTAKVDFVQRGQLLLIEVDALD